MVIGFILSLSIARMLVGAVKPIQHPGRTRPYWVHLLCALLSPGDLKNYLTERSEVRNEVR